MLDYLYAAMWFIVALLLVFRFGKLFLFCRGIVFRNGRVVAGWGDFTAGSVCGRARLGVPRRDGSGVGAAMYGLLP